MKDTFKQAIGFIDSAISSAGRCDEIANRAAARGDSATAASYRGKADAQITRAETTIANQMKKL
ncbi:hypothetical protein [Sphingomonas sp.]|uniref:hypothetical protein n=1 Tax=Sphingomonas sp. TaxID=28214 RepID=UPI0035BC686C